MAMTEPEILRSIKLTAKQLGFAFYHTRNSFASDEGFPDIAIAGPIGSLAPTTLFYETKGPRGKVTDKQAMWLDLLSASGLIARLVYEADLPYVYEDLERAYRTHLEASNGRENAIDGDYQGADSGDDDGNDDADRQNDPGR